MNVKFIVYNSSTGNIRQTGDGPADVVSLQANSGESTLLGYADYKTDYIKDGQVVTRPEMSITISGAVITGIPVGTTANIDGTDYDIDDGEIDLTGSSVGEVSVYLSNFPYLDKHILLEI